MVTPIFKIEANGKDITEVLLKNSAKITFKDEDGVVADELSIEALGDFKRPKYEDELKLWLGYKESGLYYCGLFIVQTSTKNRHSINITATGANFTSELKKKRNKSYEKMSLADIAREIAKRYSLNTKSDFSDAYVQHLSQSNESDLHLLNRLANEYNAIFSIKNNTLIFKKRIKEDKKAEDLPVFEVKESECESWEIKHSNRTLYKSCKAIWHDTKENKTKEIIVGSGEPELILKGSFKNEAEAKTKAEARLQTANRGIVSGNLTIYGQNIRAGGILKLIGFGSDNGDYTIKSVEHTLDESGYSVYVEFEN